MPPIPPAAPTAAPPPPPPGPPAAPPPFPATEPRPAAPAVTLPSIDFEELLGGRLFAWIGGIAILAGVVFFVATAIQRGWISEQLRVGLAFAGSSILVALGYWLHERRGQTQVSLVAVGTGIASLYASLVAGTSLYDLIPAPVALGVALLIGAVATLLAIRLESIHVAALGILGALASPVLTHAGTSTSALVFMAVALTSSTAVLVWQRWNWLALLAYLVSAPQLAAWALDQDGSAVWTVLPVLLGFWVLYVTAALGYELRVPTAALRPSSAALALSNVVFTSGLGWFVLDDAGKNRAATAWVIALAAVHVAAGALVALRMRRSPEIPLLFVACGIGLSAIGLALALDGPALVAGWAVEGVLLAWLSRRLRSDRALAGSVGFLVLATGVALKIAIVHDYASTVDAQHRVAALLVVAVAAIAASWFLRGDDRVRPVAAALQIEASLLVLGTLPILLDGTTLVVAVAAGVVGHAALVRGFGSRIAALGGLVWGVTAAGFALGVAFDVAEFATRTDATARIGALAAVAIAAFLSAALLAGEDWLDPAPAALEAVGSGFALLALPIAFDGAALVVAVSVGAVVQAAVGRLRGNPVGYATGGFWALVALTHVLVYEAPPRDALLNGIGGGDAIALVVAVGCAVAVAILVGDRTRLAREHVLALDVAAGVAALYCGSALVVAAVPAGGGSTDGKQLALSAFWSLVGLVLVAVGVARNKRPLRIGGIALLSLAIAKVGLYDLAQLGSLTRVGSLIALGVLLLAAAYVYQRQTINRRESA